MGVSPANRLTDRTIEVTGKEYVASARLLVTPAA
jgi:hypothetical protein